MKKLDGKLSEWLLNAKDEELMFIEMMSKGALGRLCLLITLEQQILLEKSEKKG
jgi:hypothetical protein